MVDQKPKHFTSLPPVPQSYDDVQRLLCSASVDEAPFSCSIPHRLGGNLSRIPSMWSLDKDSLWLAHKSFGDAGSVSGNQTVLTLSEGLSHFGQEGRHDSGLIPESPRRTTFLPPV